MSADQARGRLEVRPVVWPTEEEVDTSLVQFPQLQDGRRATSPQEEVAGVEDPEGSTKGMPPVVASAPEPHAQAALPASPSPVRTPRPEWIETGSLQEVVWAGPEEAAMLIKTMLIEEGVKQEGKAEDIPKMAEVAILFVGLGQETSGEIMKHLSDYEIEEVTQSIANLKNVTAEVQAQILGTFEQHLRAGAWVSQGGMDFARGVLERVVGPHKAQEILGRAMRTVSSGFSLLKNVAPDQIAPFISQEHPQTIALILSQLDSPQAGGILTQLPERMQADVAYRIATMENITPNVLKQIEESLETSLRDILAGNRDVGGPKVVADLLNCAGSSTEKSVLGQIDAQDPEVGECVRNLMFTFSDIVKLSDREIQTLMREVDQKDLVVALKGAEEELKVKILNNMSEQVRNLICEQMEFMGPMRLSEVEEVQLRIVQQLRQLEVQGQIAVVRGYTDSPFV